MINKNREEILIYIIKNKNIEMELIKNLLDVDSLLKININQAIALEKLLAKIL